MKKLLILLFSLFLLSSPSVFADDISDFQIEGVRVGDSLLDYFSEEEILSNQRSYNEETKFISSEFSINSSEYDALGIYYKSNDSKYKIYGVIGFIDYNANNIKNCYKKSIEIMDSFEDLTNQNSWDFNEYQDEDCDGETLILQIGPQQDRTLVHVVQQKRPLVLVLELVDFLLHLLHFPVVKQKKKIHTL